MNRLFPILICMSISGHATAIEVTRTFEATITTTDFPGTISGNTVSGTLTYNTDSVSMLDQQDYTQYHDFGSSSKITLEIGGVTYHTAQQASPKLITHVSDNGSFPPTFVYDIWFTSSQIVTTDTSTSASNLSINFSSSNAEGNTILPLDLPDLARWNSEAKLSLNSTAGSLQATITQLTSASTITTNLTSETTTLPSSGGKVYFDRLITNNSATDQKLKHWSHITWPNGLIYGLKPPRKLTISPAGSDFETGLSFNVPSYWPAGEYLYQVHTVTLPDADISAIGFTFTKQ